MWTTLSAYASYNAAGFYGSTVQHVQPGACAPADELLFLMLGALVFALGYACHRVRLWWQGVYRRVVE